MLCLRHTYRYLAMQAAIQAAKEYCIRTRIRLITRTDVNTGKSTTECLEESRMLYHIRDKHTSDLERKMGKGYPTAGGPNKSFLGGSL